METDTKIIEAIHKRWKLDLPEASRTMTPAELPHWRTAYKDVLALDQARRDAERRASEAEARARTADLRLQERLNAFQGFVTEVGRLATEKYSEGCKALREAV